MNLTNIDEWFPVEQQLKYISMLKGRVNITRCRAKYFVRLWAYLLLKQQQELGKCIKPLIELDLPEGFVPCTHREAYEIFYSQGERGSDRAAGLMIDKLVAVGLIEKEFDGNTTCIRICSRLSNLHDSAQAEESVQLIPDAFNPRNDAIPVASFLASYFDWMNKKPTAIPHRIARILRSWAEQYPTGMRVLRRCDTQHPVGFYMLFPIAGESEHNFFLPLRKSFYLGSSKEIDPLKMPLRGDANCTFVYLRSWHIISAYKQQNNICLFTEDIKKTLITMQADFPNLCDLYTMSLHPHDEQLASALGFQKTSQNPSSLIYWMHMPVDKYLALDIQQAVSGLKFN